MRTRGCKRIRAKMRRRQRRQGKEGRKKKRKRHTEEDTEEDSEGEGRANTLPHFLYGILIGSAARWNRGSEEFNEEGRRVSIKLVVVKEVLAGLPLSLSLNFLPLLPFYSCFLRPSIVYIYFFPTYFLPAFFLVISFLRYTFLCVFFFLVLLHFLSHS